MAIEKKAEKMEFQGNLEVTTTFDKTVRGYIEMLMSKMDHGQIDEKPMIPLGHGDPSSFSCFQPSAVLEDAVVKSVRSRKFNGYVNTSGMASAKRVVGDYLSRDLAHPLSPDDIYMTCGCNHAIQILVSVLARPGANILLPTPGYPHYEVNCDSSGIEARHYTLLPEKGWEVDLGSVEAEADENTVAIVVINPGNPCGTVFSSDHLLEIAKTASKLGIFVISDEVYHGLAFGNKPFLSMGVYGTIVPIVTMGSLSKRWLVPGYRLGWIAVNDPKGILKESKLTHNIAKYLSISPNPATFIQASISDIILLMTNLKSKRPVRIEIPNTGTSPVGFGGEVEDKEDVVEKVEISSTRFSVYSKRGKIKNYMEDRFCASVNIADDSKLAFFGVFDGHGGPTAAEFVAKKIEKNTMDELLAGIIFGEEEEAGELEEECVGKINEAVKISYLRTDCELLNENVAGGSCSVTSLIKNGHLIVSNAGDCRAVISKGGVAKPLTFDHRPSREDEKTRIQSNGGWVEEVHGIWRVQGSLAVSRGMGDCHLKQWVIPDPETIVLRIKPEHELLILASDGLWDKVSNQEAVDIARSVSNNNIPSSMSSSKKLVDLAISRGSSDDITTVVVNLARFV